MNKDLLIKIVGNKFFTVSFIKKDGTLRKMNARLGVKSYLKNGNKSYNAEKFNYIVVFDIKKKEYRTVNLSTIKQINANKTTLFF